VSSPVVMFLLLQVSDCFLFVLILFFSAMYVLHVYTCSARYVVAKARCILYHHSINIFPFKKTCFLLVFVNK
jgi:hypothetical protein